MSDEEKQDHTALAQDAAREVVTDWRSGLLNTILKSSGIAGITACFLAWYVVDRDTKIDAERKAFNVAMESARKDSVDMVRTASDAMVRNAEAMRQLTDELRRKNP